MLKKFNNFQKYMEFIKFNILFLNKNFSKSVKNLFNSKQLSKLEIVCNSNLLFSDNLEHFIIQKIKSSHQFISVGPKINNKPKTFKIITNPINAYLLKDIECKPSSSVFINMNKKKINILFNYFASDTRKVSRKIFDFYRYGKYFSLIWRLKKNEIIENGIYLSGPASSNYYHWMIEILPKMQFIEKLDEKFNEFPLLVDQKISQIPSIYKSLKILNNKRRIIFLNCNNAYHVKKLILFSSLESAAFKIKESSSYEVQDFKFYPESIIYIRNCMFDFFNIKNHDVIKGKRIFLGRKNSRRKYNQNEIFSFFKKNNFKIIFPEDLTLEEQIKFFHNAEIIAGPTGAAWTNIIFCNKYCRGIIWMEEILEEFSCFSNIASIVGMDLFYLLHDSDENSIDKSYSANYNLDVSDVENLFMKVTNL